MSKQYGKRDEEALGTTGKSLLKDSKNDWRTLSIFVDTNVTQMPSEWTLKPYPSKGLPSAHALYLECADPTEYEFANQLLGSWAHWQRMLECKWFMPYVDAWRDELEIKLRSEAVRNIGTISKGTSPGALNASRWLAEKGWTEKKRGRPSKQEVASERKKQALVSQEVADDLARIGGATPNVH
jgi:hypothetical protein